MSASEEKKFVMRHTFTDVKNMKNFKYYHGKTETHFNIPWSFVIVITDQPTMAIIYLECHKMREKEEWSIDATIETKILTNGGERIIKEPKPFESSGRAVRTLDTLYPLDDYLVDGNLTVECYVTIHEMTGIEEPFVNKFDDESAKELSDVVLKVKDQKFYVYKMYLAYHSTYFKSLFLGNFNESKQSEVELKDIEPEDFQNFLKVVYAMPDINNDNVEAILKLCDMYDAKNIIEQCEKFLVKESTQNLKEKFLMAVQYKLDDLKRKCMPEFESPEDIATVIPEEADQFNPKVWKELLNLALDFYKELAEK